MSKTTTLTLEDFATPAARPRIEAAAMQRCGGDRTKIQAAVAALHAEAQDVEDPLPLPPHSSDQYAMCCIRIGRREGISYPQAASKYEAAKRDGTLAALLRPGTGAWSSKSAATTTAAPPATPAAEEARPRTENVVPFGRVAPPPNAADFADVVRTLRGITPENHNSAEQREAYCAWLDFKPNTFSGGNALTAAIADFLGGRAGAQERLHGAADALLAAANHQGPDAA